MTTTTESTRALANNNTTSRGITLQQVVELTGYDLASIAMIRHNMATSIGKKPEEVPMYDLALFCHAAKALGLDPLLRQAYWIIRDGKGTLQVGIDGFRAIADRSNTYAGSEPPVFRGRIELKHDNKVIVGPEAASVVVWKIVAGHRCPFTGEARWSEFYPGDKQGFMWRKMPFHMLGKVAEGQALRKAFPAQLGAVDLAADAGEDAIERVQVVEQPRPAHSAAEYDRTIGSADWGEKQSTQRSRQQPVEQAVEQADEAPEDAAPAEPSADIDALLARNAELVEEARELGVKGFGTLKANATWPDEKIAEANRELEARSRSRNADLDASLVDDGEQQKAF